MILNQYTETCSAESEYIALSNIGMISIFVTILSVWCCISFDISCRRVFVDLRLVPHFRSILLIFLSLFLVIFPSPRYSFISSSPFFFSILILYILSSLLPLSSFPSVVSPFTDGRPSTSLRVCSWQKGVISTGRGKPGPRP